MTDLITETSGYRNPQLRVMDQDDRPRIRDLLLGRRVKKIAEEYKKLFRKSS